AARDAMVEAQDQAVLRRTLYASLRLDDLTESLTDQMLESARRLRNKQQNRVDAASKLIEEGVLPRTALSPLLAELDARRKTLDLAESRKRFWNELSEMARAEQVRQATAEAEQLAAQAMSEENSNFGILSASRQRQLEKEFDQYFRRDLPVSARGDTTFHRSLGFDHTGRLDIALNPDSPEGRWLKNWLNRAGVPYLAFRGFVPGQATNAHIHIGPPSLRLRTAD
ncbi:MAG TPA: hypothetical protein VM120_18365, partial [Bryobacteraceae bacterium]|nr:hypothetical protein [Bryobacteraceae bacterium]